MQGKITFLMSSSSIVQAAMPIWEGDRPMHDSVCGLLGMHLCCGSCFLCLLRTAGHGTADETTTMKAPLRSERNCLSLFVVLLFATICTALYMHHLHLKMRLSQHLMRLSQHLMTQGTHASAAQQR